MAMRMKCWMIRPGGALALIEGVEYTYAESTN